MSAWIKATLAVLWGVVFYMAVWRPVQRVLVRFPLLAFLLVGWIGYSLWTYPQQLSSLEGVIKSVRVVGPLD